MDKTGKEYEVFVATLQQVLLNSEKYGGQKNIVIEKNKIIKDKNGIDREFDLYWEYKLGGLTYKTIIECKDYKSPISIEKIDALIGKVHDIPELKPVFASKSGYQSGAEKKAEQNGIELLIVREQNDSDWVDEYGFHLLKGIKVCGQFIKPANITSFRPMIDGNWVLENGINIDVTKPFQLNELNNEIFIQDITNNEKYSLFDLEAKLTLENNSPGDYEKSKIFTEAYLHHKGNKYKILSYKVMYSIPEPIEYNDVFDFTQQLVGVVEFIKKGIKLKIFKNGNIHQEEKPVL